MNTLTKIIARVLESETIKKLEDEGYVVSPLILEDSEDKSFKVYKGAISIGRFWVTEDGNAVFATPNYNSHYHEVNEIVCNMEGIVHQYFRAENLKKEGVSDFKKIMDFNDVVLAGKYNGGNRGFTWVTWRYDYDCKGVCLGNYTNSYDKAINDFMERSGLNRYHSNNLPTADTVTFDKDSDGIEDRIDSDYSYPTDGLNEEYLYKQISSCEAKKLKGANIGLTLDTEIGTILRYKKSEENRLKEVLNTHNLSL